MSSFDVVVLGWSLAGAAAASSLARASLRVAWVPHRYDNGDVRTTFVLEAELAAIGPVSTTELHERVEHEVRASGGAVDGSWLPDRVSQLGRRWLCESTGRTPVTARALVFAPYGTERGMEDLAIDPDLLGPAVALEASSNAPLLRGKRVVVIGAGYRALEHATWVWSWGGRDVTLCLEGDLAPTAGTRLEADARRFLCSASVRERCRDVRVRRASRGVEIELSAAEPIVIDADVVLLAHRLDVDMTGMLIAGDGGPTDVPLTRAGLATGVPYQDHAGMFASGLRAAEDVLDHAARRRRATPR